MKNKYHLQNDFLKLIDILYIRFDLFEREI